MRQIEFVIIRKEDGYLIKSKDIVYSNAGVYINDDLETGRTDSRTFLPYHNILQINEYEVEIKDKQ